MAGYSLHLTRALILLPDVQFSRVEAHRAGVYRGVDHFLQPLPRRDNRLCMLAQLGRQRRVVRKGSMPLGGHEQSTLALDRTQIRVDLRFDAAIAWALPRILGLYTFLLVGEVQVDLGKDGLDTFQHLDAHIIRVPVALDRHQLALKGA